MHTYFVLYTLLTFHSVAVSAGLLEVINIRERNVYLIHTKNCQTAVFSSWNRWRTTRWEEQMLWFWKKNLLRFWITKRWKINWKYIFGM